MATLIVRTRDGKRLKVKTAGSTGTFNKTLGEKFNELIHLPEKKSREGLGMIAKALPEAGSTRNVPLNAAIGTPRVVAETLAESAPGFISPESLALGAATKGLSYGRPLARMAGRGLASQLESLSGAQAGSLPAAFNNARTMFRPGIKAAKPAYEAARAEASGMKSLFKGMYKPEEIVDTASNYIAKGGKLEPTEALMYRKALDKLLKSGRYVKDELFSLREEADAMAKASKNIASGDVKHIRGLYAESLRKLLPQNVGRSTSAFKTGIMTALSQMGAPGKLALTAMSPAAMGLASTGAGLATRYGGSALLTNPRAAVTAMQLIKQLGNKKSK